MDWNEPIYLLSGEQIILKLTELIEKLDILEKNWQKMKTLKVGCNACFKSWWCWKRDKCFLQQNIPISAESNGESFDKKIKRER